MVIAGIVGIWGLAIAWRQGHTTRPVSRARQRPPSRWFWGGVGVASVAMLGQVVLGVGMTAFGSYAVGDQHVFYGLVIAFAFAFAYIYRSQLRRRPALSYGVFFLFVMGLGLRAITTLMLDF